jgi:hypothetical protein
VFVLRYPLSSGKRYGVPPSAGKMQKQNRRKLRTLRSWKQLRKEFGGDDASLFRED